MTKHKKGMSVGKAVAVGAGIAAVGAGAYYLLGPNSKEHQDKMKGLILNAKNEVKKDVKKVKHVVNKVKKIIK